MVIQNLYNQFAGITQYKDELQGLTEACRYTLRISWLKIKNEAAELDKRAVKMLEKISEIVGLLDKNKLNKEQVNLLKQIAFAVDKFQRCKEDNIRQETLDKIFDLFNNFKGGFSGSN